ncbi:MAG: hypothetical protein NVSMB24_34370 [Mucilaginibacter sp.]
MAEQGFKQHIAKLRIVGNQWGRCEVETAVEHLIPAHIPAISTDHFINMRPDYQITFLLDAYNGKIIKDAAVDQMIPFMLYRGKQPRYR